MVMIAIYLFLYLYVIWFDMVPIKRNNYNKLFIFNLLTMFIAFIIVILVGFDLKVPNPSDFIENIVNLFID